MYTSIYLYVCYMCIYVNTTICPFIPSYAQRCMHVCTYIHT